MQKHKQKILVTGGAGYIGSHTIVELIQAGYEVISIDNFSNAQPQVFAHIKKITGNMVKNYTIDITDMASLHKALAKEKNITGVIHFAARKSVPESLAHPRAYYYNNIGSLLNTLEFCREQGIQQFIFSSSAAVYGTAASPVTETAPFGKPSSPYAATKQLCEKILQSEATQDSTKAIFALRYFNPIGAHPTGDLGELPKKPTGGVVGNMFAATSKKPFQIFGTNYKTRDGSAVRDYVHVVDIARAHVLALTSLRKSTAKKFEAINLGTGKGVTVFELVHAFEHARGTPLPKKIGKRRKGDLPALFASNKKAKKVLMWQPVFSADEALAHEVQWRKKHL